MSRRVGRRRPVPRPPAPSGPAPRRSPLRRRWRPRRGCWSRRRLPARSSSAWRYSSRAFPYSFFARKTLPRLTRALEELLVHPEGSFVFPSGEVELALPLVGDAEVDMLRGGQRIFEDDDPREAGAPDGQQEGRAGAAARGAMAGTRRSPAITASLAGERGSPAAPSSPLRIQRGERDHFRTFASGMRDHPFRSPAVRHQVVGTAPGPDAEVDQQDHGDARRNPLPQPGQIQVHDLRREPPPTGGTGQVGDERPLQPLRPGLPDDFRRIDPAQGTREPSPGRRGRRCRPPGEGTGPPR